MSNKFNRQYILKVETTPDEYVEIKSPFTLEFSITRNNLSSTNTATFTIYNLKQDIRGKIFKDVYDFTNFKAVQLFAGYNDTDTAILMPRCFNGNIKRAFSYRVGPDFKTTIEAYDGQIATAANNNLNITVPAGLSQEEIIKKISENMNGVFGKTIGNKFTDLNGRASSFYGSQIDAINQVSGNKAYIDSGDLFVLADSEVIPAYVRKISAENGLLGTPKRQEQMVEVEMLFEPRIRPSQYIELVSNTEQKFNGVYKVTGFTHKGTISGAVGGDCRTNITLQVQKNAVIVYDKATNEYRAVEK